MKSFVTGGAGFIGSHLVDRLIRMGEVTVYDHLKVGKLEHLEQHMKNPKFRFVDGDVLDMEKLTKEIAGHDIVFHLAANSNVLYGTTHTDADLKLGTLATYNVLEAMHVNGIKKIAFMSSSTIYGEANVRHIPENYGPLLPISFYGASKLACEALISAFCHNYGFQAWVFRLANIVGERPTHGVILDLIKKLKENPKELEVLGDGKQAKSYMEVNECADAIMFAINRANDKLNCFNVGTRDTTNVSRIAEMIIEEMGLEGAKIKYTGGSRGWKGDIPQLLMDVSKLGKLGWKARLSSDESIRIAIRATLESF